MPTAQKREREGKSIRQTIAIVIDARSMYLLVGYGCDTVVGQVEELQMLQLRDLTRNVGDLIVGQVEMYQIR